MKSSYILNNYLRIKLRTLSIGIYDDLGTSNASNKKCYSCIKNLIGNTEIRLTQGF